jgi:hypothetical protein
MRALFRILLRSGFRRGVMGGSRPWLIGFGIAAAVRLIQRMNERESAVVFSEKLEPGETLVIAHGREPR